MPLTGVYVLASLISGVSAALILGESTYKYNGCRASPCQTAYLNSVEDFCLWAPPQPALSAARNTEHTLVAWCTEGAHGTHLIPDGTISGAHLVITPEYVQVTGVGNLTNINVPADGVASASGEVDGLHGLVFTRAYGQLEQVYDWTSFVSQERFCFRACKPSVVGSTSCPRIHDYLGCSENVPGNYDTGVFEDCIGDATGAPFAMNQEVLAASSYHSVHPPSGCTTRSTIGDTQPTHARRAVVSTPGSTSVLLTSTAPATIDSATTISFPSLPTSALTTATLMNSSTPVLSSTPTSTPYSYNYTYTPHRHSRALGRPHHHSSVSSSPVSSLPSQHSFSRLQFSSTASSLREPSSTSSTSSPTSSTPSYTIISYPSSDLSSSGTPTSLVTFTSALTPTPSSTPTPTSSFPSSSYGTSSSLPEFSSLPSSSSNQSSTPSSSTTPTSPLTSPSTSSSTSSHSSLFLTFTTSRSPSSSVPTDSPSTSSATSPNSQTQLGSQCPPPSQVANAGSVVISAETLLPLILTILMIVVSSSVGVFVL